MQACQAAADTALENQADFVTVAKIYARAGKACGLMGDPEEGIKYFDKALTNKRQPEYLKAKQALTKELKEKKRREYVDPEKSVEAKNRGNEFFKQVYISASMY